MFFSVLYNKVMISKFNKFEKWFLILGILVNLIFGIIANSTTLALSNSFFAVLGSVFNTKGSPLGYAFNLLETITYIFLSYDLKYYAEALINVVGFIPMSIYGFFAWLKNMNGDTKSINVKTLSLKEIIIASLIQLILIYPYYLLLVYFDTALPFISAISLAFTILAMYFGTRMSVLNYYIYIIQSIIKIVLWLSPVLQGNYDNVPVLVTSVLYMIGDIYGIYNWNRLKRVQQDEKID